MTRWRTFLILGLLAIGLALISLWVGQQAYTWMPPQASSESVLVDNLFSFLVTIGTFIFLGVTGTLAYSVLFQQAGKYEVGDGPPIEGNITLEVVWTAIPLILVIWIGVYSYQIYDQMGILGPGAHVHWGMTSAAAATSDQENTASTPTLVDVYARQWAWEFFYPNHHINSTELHVPVNQRVSLHLISEDVIHGLYIPAFRVKQDVIPGREIDFEFTPTRAGRYRLRDSDYSGTYFAANQTYVVVESSDAYQHWLAMSAQSSPVPAANRAFDEYNEAATNPISLGWASVEPAPAPIVNFDSPVEEVYE